VGWAGLKNGDVAVFEKNFVTTNGQDTGLTLSRITTRSPLIPAKAGIQGWP
jgi:hypothetical protein